MASTVARARHEHRRDTAAIGFAGTVAPPVAVGGAALLTAETDGFATDYTYATDASRVAIKAASATTSYGLDTHYQNGGTSPKQVFDVIGALVWSPHNMIVQSENFLASWVPTGAPPPVVTAHTIQDTDATGSPYIASASMATVTGATYTATAWFLKDADTSRFPAMQIISGGSNFATQINTSSGAIANAGGALSATSAVADAGTYWQLSITYVAATTTGSVRLYPSHGVVLGTGAVTAVGTCTVDKVQVNRGAVATAYLPTTTAARFGLAVDYDPATHAVKGWLNELAATNLLLNSTALSTQSVTVSAVAYTLSFYGTGTVTLTGVSTAGPLVGTGASNRVSLTFTPTAGSLTCTVSGTVSNAQLETGTVATSPIQTFAAVATRAADNYTFLLSTIPALGAEFSIYCRFSTPLITNARHAVVVTDGTVNEFAGFAANTTARLAVTDGGVAVGAIVGPTLVANTAASAAARIKLNDCAMSVAGGAAAFDTTVTLPTVTEVRFGGVGSNAVATASFYVEKLVIVPRAWSDAELVTKSAT